MEQKFHLNGINWDILKNELDKNIRLLMEIKSDDYAREWPFGYYKKFDTISDVCSYIVSEPLLEKYYLKDLANTDHCLIINFEKLHGLPALCVRAYPPGRGLTETARKVDSFEYGVVVYKVRAGTQVEYGMNLAT